MPESRFTNRELTLMFEDIKDTLQTHSETHEQILAQVKFTNGKVRRITLYMTVIGTATATLLFTNGSQLLQFIKLII
jgi:hypothetical protein